MKINFWVLLFIFIIFYFVFQIREDVLRYYNLVSENKKFEKSLMEISKNNQGLNKDIARLSGDDLIEALARERLNLIKKGETAFKICRSKSDKM